jgi:hypothetical protein
MVMNGNDMEMNGNDMEMNPNDIGMNRPRYNLIFTTLQCRVSMDFTKNNMCFHPFLLYVWLHR